MTEYTKPTIPDDDATRKVDSLHDPIPLSSGAKPLPDDHKKRWKTPCGRRPLELILKSIALVIAVFLAIEFYIIAHHLWHEQRATRAQLQGYLDEIHQVQRRQYQEVVAAQRKELVTIQSQQQDQQRELENVQHQLMTIIGSNADTWLLSQADFLVRMAAHKLWSDWDVVTAGALLKSADISLSKMNNPSVLEARRAITQDISTLAGISQIDYDGIILNLNQLSNEVDHLREVDNDSDEVSINRASSELSGSMQEWQQNLRKSRDNFIHDFITVRRRDPGGKFLQMPHRDLYLREHIRSQLLIAAQVVPRHQNAIYRQSLDSCAAWVRAYFDTEDPNTRAFLKHLSTMSQEDITMNLPDRLRSQPLLDKQMRLSVRNSLSQPKLNLLEKE